MIYDRYKGLHMSDKVFHTWTVIIICSLLVGIAGIWPALLLAQETTPLPENTGGELQPTALPINEQIPLPEPVPESLAVQRTVDPQQLDAANPSRVTLTLQGQQQTACWGAPGRPADVMLVFDMSSSAGAGPDSNWARTQELTQILFAYLQQPVYQLPQPDTGELSRIGMITTQTGTFGPEAVVLAPLTDQRELLVDTLLAEQTTGDTDLSDGLRLAGEQLTQTANDRAKAVVLMLHDSVALAEGAFTQVQALQEAGISVYAVVNSKNIRENPIEAADLDQFNIDAGQIDPEPRDLHRLFLDITEGSAVVAAPLVRITDEISPAGVVEPFNVSNPGEIESPTRITWNTSAGITQNGPQSTVAYSYQLRLLNNQPDPVTLQWNAFFIDCNGFSGSKSGSYTVGAVPVIDTEAPTAAIINGGGTTNGSDAVPENGANDDSGIIPGFIATGFVNIPWWVWLLPLLLLFLFWFFLRRPGRPLPTTTTTGSSSKAISVQPRSVDPPRPPVLKPTPLIEGAGVEHGWKEVERVGRIVIVQYRRDLLMKEDVHTLSLQQPVSRFIPIVRILQWDNQGRWNEIGAAACQITLSQEDKLDPITGTNKLALNASLRMQMSDSVPHSEKGTLLTKLHEHAQTLLLWVTWQNSGLEAKMQKVSLDIAG
jgi:hypothetical protein